jgi:AcrR family transcriptional regulator
MTVIMVPVTAAPSPRLRAAERAGARPVAAPPGPSVPPSSTRDRLVAAAIAVFEEQGYDGARVQDVARAAGLTTGAIYANYRGKADLLFDAIGARAGAEVEALLARPADLDARELLARLGGGLLHRRDDRPPLLLDAIAAARRDPQLAELLRARLAEREERVRALIESAKASGAVAPDVDTDVFARFAMTLAVGALAMRTLAVAPPDRIEWQSLVDRLLDALVPDLDHQEHPS